MAIGIEWIKASTPPTENGKYLVYCVRPVGSVGQYVENILYVEFETNPNKWNLPDKNYIVGAWAVVNKPNFYVFIEPEEEPLPEPEPEPDPEPEDEENGEEMQDEEKETVDNNANPEYSIE